MTYKEYQKARKAIERHYDQEHKHIDELYAENRKNLDLKRITDREWREREFKIDAIRDTAKCKHQRSIERLKMNFASEDSPIKVGDLIWAGSKLIRVESIELAAFDYPMLKFFGTQMTLHGLPMKKQKQKPEGGIYAKDITSVNGTPYTYTTR